MTVKLFNEYKQEIPVKFWTFPAGERGLKIGSLNFIDTEETLTILCRFQTNDDLIDVLMLVNAIRHSYNKQKIILNIPYFPCARQDRVMTSGEPFAAQVIAQMLIPCNFEYISVIDPHSDVLQALFPPGMLVVTKQEHVLIRDISTLKSTTTGAVTVSLPANIALVSPDAGALKKIYNISKQIGNITVIECSKKRDVATGEILGTNIPEIDLNQFDVLYICDDICDGGRTFSELAFTIFSKGYHNKLVLCITHGIFSKGLEPLEMFDEIHCYNLMNEDINLFQFNNRKLTQ